MSSAAGTEISSARQIWCLTVLCCAVGLVTATVASIYTAAPDLARAIDASQTDLTWIVDAYTVSLAALLLPAGALGDRYGRKEVMIGGLAVFVAGSVVLQFADTATSLIAVRAVLGVAAAFILPSTLSLITSAFPESFRDTAVGIWTASFTLAGGISLFVTGVLLDWFSWRSSFWSVLVCSIAVLAASLTLPTSRAERPRAIDPISAVVASVAVGLLAFGLIDAGVKGWSSPEILLTLGTGLAMCGVFAAMQLRLSEPLLDVRLFAIRPFGAAAMTVTVTFAAIFGLFFMAMEYQQFVLGKSALLAAIPVASAAITIIPISLLAGPLTKRFGLRAMNSLGCLLFAASFLVFRTYGVHTSYATVFGAFALMGIGTGLNMAPCTAAILRNVSADNQGVAAAVNHTTREIGTALGVALLGGVLAAGYGSRIVAVTRHLPPAIRDAARQSIAAALAVAPHLHSHAGVRLVDAARLAFVGSVHETCLVIAVALGGVALIASVWAPAHRRSSDLIAAPFALLRPLRLAPAMAGVVSASAVAVSPSASAGRPWWQEPGALDPPAVRAERARRSERAHGISDTASPAAATKPATPVTPRPATTPRQQPAPRVATISRPSEARPGVEPRRPARPALAPLAIVFAFGALSSTAYHRRARRARLS